MSESAYLAFLVGAGRNIATFATFSVYSRRSAERVEIRQPCAEPNWHLNKVLENLDRDAKVISSWQGFYAWLGKDVGAWAAFTEDAASEFVPHWFSRTAEYYCVGVDDGPTEFIGLEFQGVTNEQFAKFRDMAGDIDTEGYRRLENIRSNLVLTSRPIFVDPIAPAQDRE